MNATTPTQVVDQKGNCALALAKAFDRTVVEMVLQAHRAPDGSRRNIRETFHALRQSPVNTKWITRNTVRDVLREHCEHCAQRVGRKGMTKVADWTPITALGVHERNQIDLIDLSAHACHVPHDAIFGGDVLMNYILVVIDIFSKFIWLFAIPDKRAERVIQCLDVLYSSIGFPIILQCDNGGEFIALSSLAYWEEKRVSVVRTGVRTPNENGQVERSVRSIRSLLADMASPDVVWPLTLPRVAQAYNNRNHAGCANLSPFEVFYGRKYERDGNDATRKLEALGQSREYDDDDDAAAATTQTDNHHGWLVDLRREDHGLQHHYARHAKFHGSTYAASHALAAYLRKTVFTTTLNGQPHAARVTSVILKTDGGDEFVDRVTVTAGSQVETMSFDTFLGSILPHTNLNEVVSSVDNTTHEDVILHLMRTAMERDRVLVAKTLAQYKKQHTPLRVEAGSVVAVKRTSAQPPFASKKRKTIAILQDEISPSTGLRSHVTVKRMGSGTLEKVPISKLYSFK